ncbi:MAG: rhomboid family intramembrane serine protease [Deltaproteobacteria bacterium]|nr:rhomboid family intramembrane serine protease [Deltaproteobacteria bacterium]
MIPLRDTVTSKNYPVVNTCIIAVNIFFFLIQLAQGSGFDRFIRIYGLVPAHFTVPEIARYFSFGDLAVSLVTFMFLHGGFLHLLGNMWSLYIFGDNIEDKLGHVRYLFFYLLCGIASGLFHMSLNLHSQIPTIGASGAIAGVMGAYLISYPNSKILTLIPIIFIPYFIEIPAFIFLGIWFLLQFLSATGSSPHGGGIAWWAHIGGFVAGIIFLKMLVTVPKSGISRKLKTVTSKKRTPGLQNIHTFSSPQDPDLSGDIIISASEAKYGTRKLVNIPWGFQRRLFRVTIPPGIKNGSVLRLRGMGKTMAGNIKGDMFLKVFIRD